MEEQKIPAENTPISRSLDENLANLLKFTENSSDVIIKKGFVCGNKIAVVTCEGMASTDTLAQLVYPKLNSEENSRILSPDALMSSFFDVFLIAAEQLDIKNLGDLTLKLQSGFAIILVDGCARAIGIGVQGYKSRGIDEPSSDLNVRGSREGFVEVIRTNMALIRRRITIDGNIVNNPANFFIPVGTLLHSIVGFADVRKQPDRIVLGGPMMGSCAFDPDTPLGKTNNAVLLFADTAAQTPTACIRCGRCVRACAANLMPTELEQAFDARDVKELQRLKVNLCMNCGACSFVCPAKRNLAEKNQLAKDFLRAATAPKK